MAQHQLQMLELEQKRWESLRQPSPPIRGPAPKMLSMQVRGVFASTSFERTYSITNKRNVNMPDTDSHGDSTTVGMLKNTIVASVNNSIGHDGDWLVPSNVLVIAEATSGGWEDVYAGQCDDNAPIANLLARGMREAYVISCSEKTGALAFIEESFYGGGPPGGKSRRNNAPPKSAAPNPQAPPKSVAPTARATKSVAPSSVAPSSEAPTSATAPVANRRNVFVKHFRMEGGTYKDAEAAYENLRQDHKEWDRWLRTHPDAAVELGPSSRASSRPSSRAGVVDLSTDPDNIVHHRLKIGTRVSLVGMTRLELNGQSGIVRGILEPQGNRWCQPGADAGELPCGPLGCYNQAYL